MMEFTKKNPKYFYELKEFHELGILEANYAAILEELINLRSHSKDGFWLNPFPDYLSPESKDKWHVFTFRLLGIKHTQNCHVCPKTAAILEHVPGLISADFSYLPAHTKINPHKGFTKMVIRAHLGLIIPSDCGIRVGNQTRTWEEGKIIVFDDSFDHEAWNNSSEDRFVLMLDIANPLWNYTVDEICKYRIDHMRDPFMLSMFSLEQWKAFYERKEFRPITRKDPD